jgi:guanylate kinase
MSGAAFIQPEGWRRHGILFVLSAPSGGGKSSLLNAIRPNADFLFSVSCTTRAPRPGERDGIDYHFISREEFERRIGGGEFLEYAFVHGNYYGTLRENILRELVAGRDVLLEIDVQGAATVRGHRGEIADSLADVFLMPPTFEILRQRLLKRGTESPEQLELRLANAKREMAAWAEYRYLIVSGTVEDDAANFLSIMRAERQVSRRLKQE